jgi:hypothetical protein
MDTNKLKNMMAVIESGNHSNGFISVVQPSGMKDVKGNVLMNAAPSGFQQDIDTLTAIKQEVIEQKFYTLDPAAFTPIVTGFGAYSSESLYYQNFQLGGNFEEGISGHGTSTKKTKTDVGYDAINLPFYFWHAALDYGLTEIRQAAANNGGAIRLIEQKERANKKNADLGIQKVAQLGISGLDKVDGILTLDNQGAANNTSIIVGSLSSRTATELNAIARDLIDAYRQNCDHTAFPTTFIISEKDKLGLSSSFDSASPQPLVTKFEFLLKAFREQTNNPNFEIVASVYCDTTQNDLGETRYALYNKDIDTLEMNVNIPYTSTAFATANGFDFQSVSYMQFSGIIAKRPKEILYFSY